MIEKIYVFAEYKCNSIPFFQCVLTLRTLEIFFLIKKKSLMVGGILFQTILLVKPKVCCK